MMTRSNRRKSVLTLSVVIAVGTACALSARSGPITASKIEAAEISFEGAKRVASQYANLPVCDGRAVICHDPGKLARISADSMAVGSLMDRLRAAPEAEREAIYDRFTSTIGMLYQDTPTMGTMTATSVSMR